MELHSSNKVYKTNKKFHRLGKSTFAYRLTSTKTKVCKRAFHFLPFPTAKKRINFPPLNRKNQTLKTNSTAYNKGFARAGVKVSSSRFVFIENFVIFTTSKQKSPALAKPRHVIGKRKKNSTKYLNYDKNFKFS